MKARKLMAAMMSVAVMGMLSATAIAEEQVGTVTVYAEKSSIGQGLALFPVEVPLYEGDMGIDVVKRAAENVQVTESEYGDYVSGFADVDNGADIPEEVKAVCPEMFGRNTEGYLSAYDYTAESGWSYFVNDEYAQVGITGYTPADGDVICFRFSVYGYGCDLGIDNTSWGGPAPLVELVEEAELAEMLCEYSKYADTAEYKAAAETLGAFGATQAEIDSAIASIDSFGDVTENKESPDTGVEGIAVLVGSVVLAAGAVLLSKKK